MQTNSQSSNRALQRGNDDIPLVSMKNISKRFGDFVANDDVTFDLLRGEVHALLGENGAGKTTLMNILYGLYQTDNGEIVVDGKKVNFSSPTNAINAGVGMVHQKFQVVPTLNVVQNILLGTDRSRLLLNISESTNRVVQLSERYNLNIDPLAPINSLSAGQIQRVEILKLLFRDARIIILDEPTSVLTIQETNGLFDIIRQLVSNDCGVVFISHKLYQVTQISNRVSVMRDGALIGTRRTTEVDERELANWMVGREVIFRLDKPKQKPGANLLHAINLSVNNDLGVSAVKNVSINIRRGEIFGIAGVAGNGQLELTEALYGLRDISGGDLYLGNENITEISVKDRIKHGLGFIPDRVERNAILPGSDISKNSILKALHHKSFSQGLIIDNLDVKAWTETLIDEFDVRTAGQHIKAGQLSGGNLQKLVVGRELSQEPQLIIAFEPTAGVDVGSAEFIRKRLLDEREKGKGVLLISSDLEEIISLSDQIGVLFQGEILGVLPEADIDTELIGMMMSGAKLSDLTARSTKTTSTESTSDENLTESEFTGDKQSFVSRYEKKRTHIKPSIGLHSLLENFSNIGAVNNLLSFAGALGFALIIAGGLISLYDVNPIDAFVVIWQSALGTKNGIGEVIVRMTPLSIGGVAVLVAFRSGLWNIGVEGQLYAGALGAALVGIMTYSLPSIVHLPLTIVGGFLFGAAYGTLPGILKAYRGSNEIITTIMLNFVAVYAISYLISGPIRDPNLVFPFPQSPVISEAARLPKILQGTRAHAGIFIAIISLLVISVLISKTVLGYRLQVFGENARAAAFGGINLKRQILLSMALSGGFAGLAGMSEVCGLRGYLIDGLSPGYGYTAIAVALLARLNAGIMLFSAFFFAVLDVGSASLQRRLEIPVAIGLIVQGLVLVFVIGHSALRVNRK